MAPEKRLDQLEPLLAEHSAQLDLHTAQLRRIAHNIQQIGEDMVGQSDNIALLLCEQAELNSRVGRLETEVAELRAEMNIRLTRIEDMVMAIYQAVQKPAGNGYVAFTASTIRFTTSSRVALAFQPNFQ